MTLTILTTAKLDRADLSGANLKAAFLDGETDLSFASLTGANLQGTNITSEQLQMATFLEDVTMPDGSVHP